MFDKVKNLDYAVENMLDSSVFDGIFPNEKQGVGDLDGLLERKGKFLAIEKKHNEYIPLGQKIMFDALCKISEFTVLIIYRSEHNPSRLEIWIDSESRYVFYYADTELLRAIVKYWFDAANKKIEADWTEFYKDYARKYILGERNN